MFARLSTFEGIPERLNDTILAVQTRVAPAAQSLEGFKGAYLLVQHQSGKIVTITLWEDEATMQSSALAAERLRALIAETSGATRPPLVEVYEVAVGI